MAPYLVRQGLAFKLSEGSISETANAGVVPMASNSMLLPVTGSWVDVPRTETLMEEVFVHRSGIPNWTHWPDRSTIGIPNYYAWGYYSLAQAALQRGDSASLVQFRDRGDASGLLGS